LNEKYDGLNEKYDGLNEKYDGLNEKFEGLNEKFDGIQNDVTDIKLTLENEIRVNIQRVAEGHLDLSRNLHEAMKPSNEVEMLAIKVRMLETDMMEIKRKIS
jgi:predicted  nucleic acid-binding Zn-ribbon protein